MADQNIDIEVRARAVLGEASKQITALVQQAEQANETTRKTQISLADIAKTTAIVGTALTGLAAGVGAVGARGAEIADLRDAFAKMNATIGNDSAAVLKTLQTSFAGTVADADLLKLANEQLTAGFKGTAAEFGLVADAARIVADRTGGDVTKAFDTLAQAMATGKTKGAELLVGMIDNEAAIKSYAESVGKSVKDLSEADKVEATRIATLAQLKEMVQTNGKAQVDFADTVDQSRVKIRNMVDGISEWVGKSADLGTFSQAVTGVSGTLTLATQAAGPLKTAFTSLLPLVGTSGLAGAFTSFGTMLSGTIMPLVSTALPLALKGLAAMFTMPLGLVVAGVMAGVAVWKNWDTIGPIVEKTYLAVKTWMVDKFAAVVESIRKKVQAVTGFFADMYDKVVGNSWVPDMISEIGVEFDSLQSLMVRPAGIATDLVQSAFRTMSSNVSSLVDGMLTKVSSSLTGWLDRFLPSWAAKMVGGLADTTMSGLVGRIPGLGGALPGMAGGLPGLAGLFGGGGGAAGAVAGIDAHIAGLSAAGSAGGAGFLGSFGALMTNPWTIGIGAAIGGGLLLKKLFGGPSEQEKEGRAAAAKFREGIEAALSESQLAEAAGVDGVVDASERWKLAVIGIRDAYIAAGKTEAEALAAANRLFEAEKKGGAEVQRVIEEISKSWVKQEHTATDSVDDIQTRFNQWFRNHHDNLVRLLNDNQRTWAEVRDDALQALNAIPTTIPIGIEWDVPPVPGMPLSGGGSSPAPGDGSSGDSGSGGSGGYDGGGYDQYEPALFHRGGFVTRAHRGMYLRSSAERLAADEVRIIAQTGEGILNRTATARVGGEAGVNALNNGGTLGGGSIVIESINVTITGENKNAKQLARELVPEIVEQIDRFNVGGSRRKMQRVARARA
jgi:hypothetical protein